MGCEVQDLRDLMAFNNPQELLAIEEVYRQRQGQAVVEAPSNHGETLAPAGAWDNLLREPFGRGAPAVPAMVRGGGALAANPQRAGRLHAPLWGGPAGGDRAVAGADQPDGAAH